MGQWPSTSSCLRDWVFRWYRGLHLGNRELLRNRRKSRRLAHWIRVRHRRAVPRYPSAASSKGCRRTTGVHPEQCRGHSYVAAHYTRCRSSSCLHCFSAGLGTAPAYLKLRSRLLAECRFDLVTESTTLCRRARTNLEGPRSDRSCACHCRRRHPGAQLLLRRSAIPFASAGPVALAERFTRFCRGPIGILGVAALLFPQRRCRSFGFHFLRLRRLHRTRANRRCCLHAHASAMKVAVARVGSCRKIPITLIDLDWPILDDSQSPGFDSYFGFCISAKCPLRTSEPCESGASSRYSRR